MTNSDKLSHGECRCGRVRFLVRGEPLVTSACHCTGCQKMTGSAFSLSALYPISAFEVTEGETVIGGLHGGLRHQFCDHCKSWLFTLIEGMDELVNVRATLLDTADTYEPFIETYTSERLAWAKTPAVHSFERFPERDAFPALLAAFAERAAR
ncbi:GFA family protein [Fulvimarina sp. 2208YS6-2-32]|uniref:GFA family protein n=1 Tax=Fulvimarina uroteuthidis TaxID=3098149 RepID=A0ABU5HXS5_9HYPH|nr:GFA family protein [Fulvimarina sp. 2208YS6-2-32]MDY8107942.1 GFA family protein [Fulvimarina sp. 2208YS6-2-32]